MTKKKSTSKISSSPKRKVSHKGARQKGLNFEREIANELGHIFPEAKRHLEYQADEAKDGMDIANTDRLIIQCKNKQNYVPIGTINKEIRTKDPNAIPILVTKGNKLEAMAVLPFKKLVTLLEIAYGLELPFRTFDQPLIVRGKQISFDGKDVCLDQSGFSISNTSPVDIDDLI